MQKIMLVTIDKGLARKERFVYLLSGPVKRMQRIDVNNVNKWLIIAVIYATYAVAKIKPEKNIQAWTGFEPMTSAILTGTVLYQLSYQANWELVIRWVLYIPA